MAEERKFLFDVSFDEPKPQEHVEAAAAEEAPEVEVAPTFSEDDMQKARDEAFAKGKEEGVAEAAAATEQAILKALEQVEAHFTELFDAEEEAQTALTEDAIVVAVAIVRKVFPSLNERQAQAEMERMVRTAMERILEDPKVIIYVAPELVEPLYARLETLATQAAYKGEVEVIAHADIATGDCRVEWTGGGATRITDELWKEVDEIVERNLSSTGDEHLIEEPEAVADLVPPPPGPIAPEPEAKADAEKAESESEADAEADSEKAGAETENAESESEPEPEQSKAGVEAEADDAATGEAETAEAPDDAYEAAEAAESETAETAETPEETAESAAETADTDDAGEPEAAAEAPVNDAQTPEEAVAALAGAEGGDIDKIDEIDDTVADDAPDASGDNAETDREHP